MTVPAEVLAIKGGPAAFWASKSPEERSEIMRQRMLKRKKNAKKAAKNKYPCPQCDEVLKSGPKLANHIRYHHPKKGKRAHAGPQVEDLGQFHTAYVFGKVETLIEHYADSAGISRPALALGVAELIQRKEGRKVLGA